MSSTKYGISGKLKKEVGARLRAILGMESQKDFARALDVSPQRLNDYLAGRNFPSEEFLYRLAKVRDVNLHWLVTGDGEVYVDEAKNVSEIEKMSALVGMKNLMDQFSDKVAEAVQEYQTKTKQLEERTEAKKKNR